MRIIRKYKEQLEYKSMVSNYNRLVKVIKPYYKTKLFVLLPYYFYIFNYFLKQKQPNISTRNIVLLMLYSFSKLLNDNKSSLDIINNLIDEYDIDERLKNVSYNILVITYKIIKIVRKEPLNVDTLLDTDNSILLYGLENVLKKENININEYIDIFNGD
jgi:hypothetical protein